jgi:potassium-dependent mechanosensitive channel
VPNSSLISGVVKNRVRSDRTGRVIAPVSVPRTADPVRAAELIAECARGHAEVLKEPPPRVLFKRLATPGLSSTSSASWPTSISRHGCRVS